MRANAVSGSLSSATPAAPLGVGTAAAFSFAVLMAASGSVHAQSEIVGWGSNAYGQSTAPAGIGRVVSLDTGWGGHTVARKADGSVFAWGRNDFGQCNIPASASSAQHIDAGHDHSIALRNDGTVVCWGRNNFGQLNVPADLGTCVAVDAGYDHNLAIRANGTVRAWGSNWAGQTVTPASLNAAIELAAGGGHNIVRRPDGSVFCWGYNNYGECNVPGGTLYATQVSAGDYFSVALLADGTIRAWGRNQYGAMNIPADLGSVRHIDAGQGHIVAARTNGTVAAWGRNIYGETTVPAGLTGVMKVTASYDNSAALRCPEVVRVPEDAPTLQAAADLACPNVPMTILLGPGTWPMRVVVPGEAYFITIRGAGQAQTTVTDTADGVPLTGTADASNYPNIVLEDATIADVNGTSVLGLRRVLVRDSVITLLQEVAVVDSRFERCSPASLGAIVYTGVDVTNCEFVASNGCIQSWPDAPASITDCDFTDCTGFCVRVYASCCPGGLNDTHFQRCTFTRTAGNAVQLLLAPHPQAPTVVTRFTDCTFTDNVSPVGGRLGGAVAIGSTDLPADLAGNDTATFFTNCTFTGNRAASGGALYLARNHQTTLTGCSFVGNAATSDSGGAIDMQFEGWDQLLVATNCSFSGNSAPSGGGAVRVRGWFGRTRLTGCSFVDNDSSIGGALRSDRQNLDIDGCLFEGNTGFVTGTGTGAGGAIDAFISGGVGGGPPTADNRIRNSTFRNNSTTGGGGAINFYYLVSTAIEDCVFEGNASGVWGGGAVRIQYLCPASVRGCAFTGNTSSGPGSGVYTLQAAGTTNPVIEQCDFRQQPVSASGVRAVEASTPTNFGANTFCACGAVPFSGNIIETSPNCVAISCDDANGDGRPDECDLYLDVPSQYATIQAAIDAAPKGVQRVVRVASGTYNEAFALNGKNVVVRGVSGNGTILDGTGLSVSIARFTGGEPATAGVENLVFRNGTVGTAPSAKAGYRVGGALYARNSDAFVRNCRFESNHSDFGGAAYFFLSGLSLEDCVFSGNAASNDGGALMAFRCAGSIVDSAFTDNDAGLAATGSGSAVKFVGARTAGGINSMLGCTVVGNMANVSGAAIEQFEDTNGVPGVLRVLGCSVTDNTSGQSTPTGAGGLRVIGRQQSCVIGNGTTICDNAARNVSGGYLGSTSAAGGWTVCDCEADVFENGTVNGADLGILLSLWGSLNPDGTADLDHDGQIGAADLAAMLNAWGNCN